MSLSTPTSNDWSWTLVQTDGFPIHYHHLHYSPEGELLMIKELVGKTFTILRENAVFNRPLEPSPQDLQQARSLVPVQVGLHRYTAAYLLANGRPQVPPDRADTYALGANRLIQFNGSASYTYFGELRIKKVIPSNTTTYIYSGNVPIAEYTNGSLSAENIYARSQLIAVLTPSGTTYYHSDHLSVRAQTDAAGNPSGSSGNLPFGDPWYTQGNSTKWKFTSYERDAESGNILDYAQFRSYNTAQGRFMSADLLSGNISNPQSLNRYAYVLGDPINRTDPFGLVSQPVACNGTEVKDINGVVIACFPIEVISIPSPFLFFVGDPGQVSMSAAPPTKDDCHRFADMVEQIGKDSADKQQFMDKMASTFTAAKDSSIEAMREGANKAAPPATRGFRDSGFKSQFRDGSNQVRHFVGGLVAGYDLGRVFGLAFMNSREEEGKDDPDIRLNSVSTDAGASIADYTEYAKMPFGLDFKLLADLIRDKVCDHK